MTGSDRPTAVHWIEYPPVRAGGRDVILLHGLGSSAGDWILQAPVLQDRHRVLAVDLPGFGKSPPLPGWPKISAYARAVTEAMTEAGVPAAHVVGLSLGGSVAVQLGIDSPERVLSLTLVNSFARIHVRPVAALRTSVRFGLVLAGRMDRVGAWVAQELFPEPQQAELRALVANRLAQNTRRSYIQAGLALARFDAVRGLGEVRCPTLIVAGENDTTIPLSAKHEMARRIRGARMVLMERSGHASPIDEAQRFNDLLEGFLEQVEGGRTDASGERPAESNHSAT
jgi:pimeloyl-ACP methyl ester carboxylesterase